MARALVVYASTTGATELMATFIADGMEEAGMDVTLQDAAETAATDLLAYDVLALGASTWEGGRMQEDFVGLYDDMGSVYLGDKSAAAFGAGDSSYGHFCEAVDKIEDRLRERGAHIAAPGLRIDGEVQEAAEIIEEWGRTLARVCVL